MNAKIILFAVLTATSAVAAVVTIPNEGGTYNVTQYRTSGGSGDFRPANMAGDQTWVANSAVSYNPFYPGSQNLCDYWQTYTGKSITSYTTSTTNGFRVMKGNVVFENAVISTTTENKIGYTGPVKLVLRKGGSLYANADDVRIGNSYQSGTDGTATVFMEEPSTLAVSGKSLTVGSSLPGALWMDGGLLAMTNGCLYVGKHGYVRLNGGTISLRAESAATAYVGSDSTYASFHISGGTLSSRKSNYADERYFRVGTQSNTAVDFYADGGLANLWNERFTLGYWSGSTGTATLTVDGTADVHVGLLVMGPTDKAGTAIVNVNGGTLTTDKGLADYGKVGPTRRVNFDGGTWVGSLDINWPVTVYPNGGTFHVASGGDRSVGGSLRLAQGWGVKEITLTSAGSGYVSAPQVTISGGSGSGATGYAILNKDRTIARVVVTCRGENYAENDELTVSFASTTGSGAAATATLAPNGSGTMHKTGAGMWRQKADIAFDGDLAVDEGIFALHGVALTGAQSVKVGNGASIVAVRSGTAGTVMDSAINRIDVNNGAANLTWSSNVGIGRLTIGELNLNHGAVLVHSIISNDLRFVLTDNTLSANSAADCQIVNGLVYQKKEKSGYHSPSVFERLSDGALSAVTNFTATPTLDANFMPTYDGNHATEATALQLPASLNCVVLPLSMPGGGSVYVKSDELVEIKSGMIIHCRPQSAESHRFSMVGAGAFTTRAPGGMFIYADDAETGKRSMNDKNSGVSVGKMRRFYGPFADPDDHTSMALTIVGEKESRPERGTVAWLTTGRDSYSGGLNLVNGGVVLYDQDSTSFGTNDSPIRAYGYSSIGTYNAAFNIGVDHPIYIASDAALIFSSSTSGNVIAAPISGAGDLLTADVDRSGISYAYTGDQSNFTGTYYIQGHARIAPATLSSLAGVCLADGTNGVGVIETSGTLTRTPGTDKGEICWKLHTAYGTNYKLCGGFAAYGGNFTVNLGGDGRALVPESDYLPKNAMIQLQSQYADGALDFQNGFALNGKTQKVRVWSGKSATLSGAVGDAVGGGQLAVEGNLVYSGTLTATTTNLAAAKAMIAVNGDLDLSASTVALDNVTEDDLAAYKEGGVALATATGRISGRPTLSGIPAGWTLRVRNGALKLVRASGILFVVE